MSQINESEKNLTRVNTTQHQVKTWVDLWQGKVRQISFPTDLGDGVEIVDRVLEVGGARGDEHGVLGRVEAQRVRGRAAAPAQLQNGPAVSENGHFRVV